MRITVDGGGYIAAASAFTDANHYAALQHDTLAGKLEAYAAMAGDDETSTDFAAAYDQAATQALATIADTVDAFASLARLTAGSLDNHTRAEDANILTPGAVVYDGTTVTTSGTDTHRHLTVLPTTPPSSLGGDPPQLTDRENWILDRIEGFVWPNADTARLRDAAHTWRTTASALDHLTDHCDTATAGLATERSPEIPLALDHIADLRTTLTDLTGQLTALADACDDYATHVETTHDQTKALLAEILQMVVEGIVISLAIGLITGGAATPLIAGATAARVAAQAPRFHALIATLRGLAAASATRARAARSSLRAAQAKLDKFLGTPARNEYGFFRVGDPVRSGWLKLHEKSGSHTLVRHVGKSVDELQMRVARSRYARQASSFASQSDAERLIARLLDERSPQITTWLESSDSRMRLTGRFDESTGTTVDRGGRALAVHGMRVILEKDDSMRFGYRILTAFPEP